MAVKLLYYILAFFLFIVPIFIFFAVINFSYHMLLYFDKKSKKIMIFTRCFAFIIGCIIFIWNFDAGYNLIVIAREIGTSDDVVLAPGEMLELDALSPEDISYSEEKTSSDLNIISKEDIIMRLKYSDDFTMRIAETYGNIETNQSYNLTDLGEDIIALDIVKGNKYSKNQLVNQKLLIPYEDDGKEILFYGQYNENNYWDGSCIFNVYGYNEDSKDIVLETILEAEYDDGNLISYKKVFRSTTSQGVDVWSIFYGEIILENNEGSYARGETWNYFSVNEYVMAFDTSNAEVEDIIYVEDFVDNLKNFSFIEGYYCGNISNGYYNDDTGEAYTVKYTQDGHVRTVYMGKFMDGLPDDQSGNAWQIVFDNSDNAKKYFYYKGNFKNNRRQGTVSSKDYVTQKQIDEIIKDMKFNCELNWYDENSNSQKEGII